MSSAESHLRSSIRRHRSRSTARRQLCLFGENVTPNAHALEREFVLSTIFICDGEVQAPTATKWTNGRLATRFRRTHVAVQLRTQRNGKKILPTRTEGRFPIAFPANGYLWNLRGRGRRVISQPFPEFCHTPRKWLRAMFWPTSLAIPQGPHRPHIIRGTIGYPT